MTDELETKARQVADDLLSTHPGAGLVEIVALGYLHGLRDGTQETIDRIDAMQVALERLQ